MLHCEARAECCCSTFVVLRGQLRLGSRIMIGKPYDPRVLEPKWQERWHDEKVFTAKRDNAKPKFFCYEFPPFPTGSLHMGHVRNYVIGDTIARFKRLMGYNVLYVQGFDSLGLPVEEAALKAGQRPKQWIELCIAKMKKAMLQLGLSYDQTRFTSYHDPQYYRWTQWLFLKLYKAGMIYRAETWVGWCDKCQTAVAAELIEDGRCWRCGSKNERRMLCQWFINVQKIAPALLEGLEGISMSRSAKATQRNWIGRKEGIFLNIEIQNFSKKLEVFTTRSELIYGVTFFALAPEHPLLPDLLKGTTNEKKVLEGVRNQCALPRIERLKAYRGKGIFTHRFGNHPLTGRRIPIYVAPFVLAEFGTGAVLGCPAHGKSDFDFAKAMDLPAIQVVAPEPGGLPPTELASKPHDHVSQSEPYLGAGILMNSGRYDGLSTKDAAESIAAELIRNGCARKGISFSVKNWCISRQRYWSAPIPIVYCGKCGVVPVPEEDLPVQLPTEGVCLEAPSNPLESHTEFVDCRCPDCGIAASRETSTLDTFVNSSWAYLKYCNTRYEQGIFDPKAVEYWMPCDIGIGGSEQITVGNFYFRVILNILGKIGVTRESEPWKKFLFHGLVMKDGQKMSKSLGNIVEPEYVIEKFGADAVRFHTLFMARPVSDVNWDEEKVRNSHRFLMRIWNIANEILYATETFDMTDRIDGNAIVPSSQAHRKFLHYIEVATERIQKNYERLEFQRSCQNLIIFVEKLEWFWQRTQANMNSLNRALLHKGIEKLLVLMNPIAPHMSEELWERFGNTRMICSGEHLRVPDPGLDKRSAGK